MASIGKTLASLRAKAHLSQQELATRAGVSLSVVFQLEQGAKSDPRFSTVAKLARALRVSLDAFTDGKEKD